MISSINFAMITRAVNFLRTKIGKFAVHSQQKNDKFRENLWSQL